MPFQRTNLTPAVILAAFALASTGLAAEPKTFGIANARFPEPGLMVAGQPDGEQLQLLAEEEGYRTVIDLRQREEPRDYDEAKAARQNGLVYVNIPVTLATLGQATIDLFLEALGRAERPVLLHCSSGNRAGALYYAWLVLEKGVPPEEALKRARAAGLRQPELVQRVQHLIAERSPARK